MQFFQTPNIDFIGKRRIAYVVSLSLFIIGMISMVIHGGLNLGIDSVSYTHLTLPTN